jgi:hypothetical protein
MNQKIDHGLHFKWEKLMLIAPPFEETLKDEKQVLVKKIFDLNQ